MSGNRPSPTSLRIPKDAQEAIGNIGDDRDISDHKAAIRCIERGVAEFGYGEFAPKTDEGAHWFGDALSEVGKALAYMALSLFAIGFYIVNGREVLFILQASAILLSAAVLVLLIERRAKAIARVLGLPKESPLESAEESGESS